MTPREIRYQGFLAEQLENIVNELDTDCCLTPAAREAMIISLTEFSVRAIKKFITGQKQHGGNITDRDLDKEIEQEQIDLFWYGEAKKWKHNKELGIE